jgi:ribose 5-phosphate isomerase A
MEQNLKQIAAERAAEEVVDGMIVGLGTGSTAAFMVEALGRRVQAGLKIIGIPTSEATASQARGLGIPLTTLDEHSSIDLTIDGADEIDPSLNLIKGLGGALLREKIVASASKRLIVIADESKLVEKLGVRTAVPVEVVPFGWKVTAEGLEEIGAKCKLRFGVDGKSPILTDGGHYIVDCKFDGIEEPLTVASQIDGITGVVEHGLFLGLTSAVFVGAEGGVRELSR